MHNTREELNNIQRRLEELRDKLREGLKRVIATSFPKETDYLAFEILGEHYSIKCYVMDDMNSMIGAAVSVHPEFDEGILPSQDYGLKNVDLDDAAQMEVFRDFYRRVREMLIQWFSDCWDKAGGQNFQLPAEVMFHDDNKVFDLKMKEWKKIHYEI